MTPSPPPPAVIVEITEPLERFLGLLSFARGAWTLFFAPAAFGFGPYHDVSTYESVLALHIVLGLVQAGLATWGRAGSLPGHVVCWSRHWCRGRQWTAMALVILWGFVAGLLWRNPGPMGATLLFYPMFALAEAWVYWKLSRRLQECPRAGR